MLFSLPGTHVPHRKTTQHKPTVRMTPPSITVPMLMHIGKPAVPTVQVGDTVKVGTKIGQADGAFSSHVYAGVSGKVVKIVDHLLSNGNVTPAVVIESDGLMTVDESVVPPTVANREDLIAAVETSGIVGLGGAGFPTHIKLNADPARMEYLIINGAECEPYITSDTVTMLTRADDMAYALDALHRFLGIKTVIIGIEDNKKEAIAAMKAMACTVKDCNVQVKALPSVYPQGGEKVLVYHTTGRQIPTGKLPIDVGCVVINCTTLASIGTYLKTGMPLVEKCVTVDGGAVADPQNVIVPIGTSFADLFDVCGGLTGEPAKLLYGGPMMGIAVPDETAPVLKNTNAVLALTEQDIRTPKETACIRCGRCANTCPFRLAPAEISRAYENGSADALEELSVNTCMECGCCSFVCPAHRPLVQNNKLAKQFLRDAKAKEGQNA